MKRNLRTSVVAAAQLRFALAPVAIMVPIAIAGRSRVPAWQVAVGNLAALLILLGCDAIPRDSRF